VIGSNPACINKIHTGAKPSDLPVEEPTKFQLFLNFKNEVGGLTVPATILARADEVIE